MSSKFVVGYDGSPASRRALEFSISRAKLQGGSVVLAHVLEWSPYSFLTPSEIEERHKRRKEELARAEDAVLAPIVNEMAGQGVEIETVLRYGNIADTICAIASELKAAQIMVGRSGHSNLGARVFGSVAGHLVQSAPVPCTIVP